MGRRSFKQLVEQELGGVPKFFIYAVLEWVMIFMLFIGGFVAFLAYEFARFFELPIPCLLCARLDLLGTTDDLRYNESICDNHKKSVSCLAFCHVHKRLSDIRNLCESCLLSFATERETDCDRYKSLVGILHKDVGQLLVDEDNEVQHSLPAAGAKKDERPASFEKSNEHRCTCCGHPLKVESTDSKGRNSPLSSLALSPSADHFSPENNDRSRGLTLDKPLKEDGKGGTMPMVPEGDEEDKTPNFTKSNKFFGIPLSDSSADSPRWAKTPRKILLHTSEFAADCNDEVHIPSSPHMGRKSLMALYMELDEERNASAVAAYNAMAMITRLQAEKAAVQMEALQYQRMMEEQAEYDQETLEEMTNLVAKREEELNDLEIELEVYRAKYGRLQESDFEKHAQRDENDEVNITTNNKGDDNDNNREVKTSTLSSSNGDKPETALITATRENSTTQQDHQSESNSSNPNKVEAAEAAAMDKTKKVGTDSDPTVEKTGGEATAKSKKAMRQMDRMKILEKKMHISTMGRFQRQNSEIGEDFEE